MHVKAALLVSLALGAVACSAYPSDPINGSSDLWADRTDWIGSVAMKTGTVLVAKLHFSVGSVPSCPPTARLSRDCASSWYVQIGPALIENSLTGAQLTADNFPAGPGGSEFKVNYRDRDGAFDGRAGCLGLNDNATLQYRVAVTHQPDETLKGTLSEDCIAFNGFNTGEIRNIDVQQIVLHHVNSP